MKGRRMATCQRCGKEAYIPQSPASYRGRIGFCLGCWNTWIDGHIDAERTRQRGLSPFANLALANMGRDDLVHRPGHVKGCVESSCRGCEEPRIPFREDTRELREALGVPDDVIFYVMPDFMLGAVPGETPRQWFERMLREKKAAVMTRRDEE